MSNLIPEKRVNKNGVAVTKHVRANQSPAASLSFPSPVTRLSGTRRSTPLLKDTLALFQKEATDGFSLDDLAPEALEKIEAMLKASSETRAVSNSLTNSIGTALLKDTLAERITYMHNIAVFAPTLTAAGDDNLCVSVSLFITGLDYYSGDVLWPYMDYLTAAPESATEKTKSLMEFTLKASLNPAVSEALIYDAFAEQWDTEKGVQDVYYKLRSEELAIYIMEHPEHGDAILDIVEEAGEMLPVKLMVDRLNHDVSSLRNGLL